MSQTVEINSSRSWETMIPIDILAVSCLHHLRIEQISDVNFVNELLGSFHKHTFVLLTDNLPLHLKLKNVDACIGPTLLFDIVFKINDISDLFNYHINNSCTDTNASKDFSYNDIFSRFRILIHWNIV